MSEGETQRRPRMSVTSVRDAKFEIKPRMSLNIESLAGKPLPSPLEFSRKKRRIWWPKKLFMEKSNDKEITLDATDLANRSNQNLADFHADSSALGLDAAARKPISEKRRHTMINLSGKHSGSILPMSEDDRELFSWGSFQGRTELSGNNLALFEEPSAYFVSSYLKGYTTPGPLEREESRKKKANLGVMLGVYLPTIQHILGVTMFIRLFWIVGIAGIMQTFLLLTLCCLCTFLTCISVSAVATNGNVESGGAYFMISRNLGPEFGSAVGILFYLANTVAASMYLVGGVEIILLYIFPGLTIGGIEVHSDTGTMGMMSHNLRLYSTILLLIEFAIVAMGVRFVQLLAPVSLVCVILSILACYAGAIEKTLNPLQGQHVCMLGDHLLQARIVLPKNASVSEICYYCNASNSGPLLETFCPNSSCSDVFLQNDLKCINGYPGINSHVAMDNFGPSYMNQGDYIDGKQADKNVEVFQDVKTTFFVLLAIYFPAVTGILTGANMSGDLKNPQSSIPCGTIAAQLTTSFIYFSLAFVFGAAIDRNLLKDKYGKSLEGEMIVANLAWPSPWVLLIGSFTSTFGAALQCLCSAPRLLQSIAKDNVIPFLKPFAIVTKNNEPFIGLILTTIIAELAILLGAMDQIAAVVDFFFLMCYAFVNVICALHSLLGAPNWRPRFRYYHWSLSLLGAGLCFFIMFSTHWDYAVVSCILCVAIYKYVEWKGAKKEWGDGIRGLALTTAQYSLMKIDEKDPHPKNFRPQLLLLLSIPWSKELVDVRYLRLIHLASQLKASRGLTVVVAVIRGDPLSENDRKKADEIKKRIEFDMQEVRLRGFAKALVYGETQIGGCVSTLIQSVGMGGLRPNTLLLAWPKQQQFASESVDSEYQIFADKLHAGVAMEMCLLVAKDITDFPAAGNRLSGLIDIYWIVQDGGLCVLISYLLSLSKVWRGCKLRIIAIAQEMDNNAKMQADLQKYVYQLRIDAEILIVELSDPKISKNAFERTLLMEERTKFLKDMSNKKLRDAAARFAQEISQSDEYKHLAKPNGNDIFDVLQNTEYLDTDELIKTIRKRASSEDEKRESESQQFVNETEQNSTKSFEAQKDDSASALLDEVSSETTLEERKNGSVKQNEERKESTFSKNRLLKMVDKRKVLKMHTAVRLNELILEHSSESQLILLNLPKPPKIKEGLEDYMQYLQVLSNDVNRVLFVRGTGKEVITTSS